MAKKKDEYDFEDNDDFGDDFGSGEDLDFDDLDALMKDDRDASVLQVSKDALKDAFFNTDPSAIKDRIKGSIERTMPDKIKNEYDDFSNLYNGVTDALEKQTEGITKDLKTLGKKVDAILPKEGMLRDIFSKIYEKDEDTAKEAELSEEARKQQEALNNAMAAMGELAEVQKQSDLLNNALEDKRTASTNEILKVVAKNSNATKLFNYEYASKFQRKSLELQFRTVGILKDQLESNKMFNQEILKQLAVIGKNTSLPDIVKQRTSEMLAQGLKAKIRDKALGALFDNTSLWEGITKNAVGRINSIGSSIKDYIGMGTDAADMLAGMTGDDMPGMSFKGMAASMGADFVRDKVDDSILGKIQNKLWGSKGGKKVARWVKGFYEDPSAMLGEQAENMKNKGGWFGGLMSKVFGEAANIAKVSNKTRKADLRRLDPNQPDTLDVRTKISINRVIPGYLRKILAETYATRMGIKEADLRKYELLYNYDTDTFKSSMAMTGLLKGFVRGNTNKKTAAARSRFKSMFSNEKVVEAMKAKGLQGFTDKELQELSNAGLLATSKNNVGGMRFLQSKEFLNMLSPELRKKMEKSTEVLYDLADNDDYFQEDMRTAVTQMRTSIPGFAKEIEEQFKAGNIDQLKALGLVKYNRETREYEVDDKGIEKLMFDQFGISNHTDIESVKDENLVDVKKTIDATVKKSDALLSKSLDLGKKAYDRFIPKSMKEDINKLKTSATNKANELKGKALEGFNVTKDFVKERANVDYFTKGGLKNDINAAIEYCKSTVYPKIKERAGDWSSKLYDYLPDKAKKKLEQEHGKLKGMAKAQLEKMFERLSPEDQAYVMEKIAKAKKIKLSTVETTMINLVKKAKTKIMDAYNNFDADALYNKTKGFVSTIANNDLASNKELAKNLLISGKNVLKSNAQLASEKFSQASGTAKRLGRIAYTAGLSPEVRTGIESVIGASVEKLKGLVPDKVYALIEQAKTEKEAIKLLMEYRASLSPEERAAFDKELLSKAKELSGMYADQLGLTKAGNMVKDAYNKGASFLKEAGDMAGDKLKQVMQNVRNRADAINALKSAAETNDTAVVEKAMKELKEVNPEIANDTMVKDAYENAKEWTEEAEGRGRELVRQANSEKDPSKKAGIISSILGKAWGIVPMKGLLKLAYQVPLVYMKTLWKVEKFLWKHVYGRVFKGIGKAGWWIAKNAIFKPLGKIGKFLADKSGLTALFKGVKGLLTKGVSGLKNLGGLAMGGLGALFGRKKRVVNGVEVDENGNPLRDKKKGGFWDKVKGIGSKLIFILGGLFTFFKKFFGGKGGGGIGKIIRTGVKWLAKGLWNATKGLGKMLGGWLKDGISWAFKGVLNMAKNAWEGVKNVGGKVVEGAKNLTSSAWNGIKNFGSWIGGKVTQAAGAVVDGVKYVGGKLMDFYKGAWEKVKAAYKWVNEQIFQKIVKALGNFKEKAAKFITKRIGPGRAMKMIAKLGTKLLQRLSPAGAAFLAIDVGEIAYNMIKLGASLLGAISLCYIGFDVFDSSSEVKIKPDALEPGDDPEAAEKEANAIAAANPKVTADAAKAQAATEKKEQELQKQKEEVRKIQKKKDKKKEEQAKKIEEKAKPSEIPESIKRKEAEAAIEKAAKFLKVDPKFAKDLANKLSGFNTGSNQRGFGLYNLSLSEMEDLHQVNKDRLGIGDLNYDDPYQQALLGLIAKNKYEASARELNPRGELTPDNLAAFMAKDFSKIEALKAAAEKGEEFKMANKAAEINQQILDSSNKNAAKQHELTEAGNKELSEIKTALVDLSKANKQLVNQAAEINANKNNEIKVNKSKTPNPVVNVAR